VSKRSWQNAIFARKNGSSKEGPFFWTQPGPSNIFVISRSSSEKSQSLCGDLLIFFEHKNIFLHLSAGG